MKSAGDRSTAGASSPSIGVLFRGERPVRRNAGGGGPSGVASEGVERLAFVGPLLRAIVTGHDSPVAIVLGAGSGGERRPGGCALVVAGGFARRSVAREGVERLAVRSDERAVLFGHARRRRPRRTHQGERSHRRKSR